jgi:hypothetical protein
MEENTSDEEGDKPKAFASELKSRDPCKHSLKLMYGEGSNPCPGLL